MKKLFATTAIAALMAMTGHATAQQDRMQPPAAKENAAKPGAAAKLQEDDKEFAKKAAAGGIYEVEAGKLAQQKAQTPQVKQLGERIARDHQQANDKLKSLVKGAEVELPKAVAGEHKEHLEKLQKAEGGAFDRQYVEMMIEDHEKDIEAFEEYAEDGEHAQLKSFAQQTLPILEQHREMAQQAQRQMREAQTSGTPGGATSGSSQAPGAASGNTVPKQSR
jgi:putative membrane protein